MDITFWISSAACFKVKRTTSKKCCMCPCNGLQVKDKSHCHHRFCTYRAYPCCFLHCLDCGHWTCPRTYLQCDHEATVVDITPKMLNKESWKVDIVVKVPRNVAVEVKLEDVYAPANPLSSVTKGSERGSSPRASLSDNGNPNVVLSDADSLCPTLGHEMPSSSEPEQTRSENVPNGGSGLSLEFQDDRNRPSIIINGNNVVIEYHSSATDLGGHTFIQNAGSRDSRQYQAGNVSGGTVNQGNVPFAGGGAANMEDDG